MTGESVVFGEQGPIEQILAGGETQHVGWFRFHFTDQSWEWSPQVQRMHGYEPGTVQPTTEIVLAHKHPDDHAQVVATLEEAQRTASAFSSAHRIIDTSGEVHRVVVVADQLFDDDGTVIGTHGFYIDVTPLAQAENREQQERVSEAVAEITEARGSIEQTKGMLMLIYRISADSAFELLKWRSQETNTKLRVLAEQISTEFLELSYRERLPHRSVYDRLLLTAHLRVEP